VNAACDNQSTPRLAAKKLVLRVCAMFERETEREREICFLFRFRFRSTLLDFTSRIERLHVCYNCADVWRVLAYFRSEYNRARPSTGRSGQVADSVCVTVFMTRVAEISCSRSTVAVAAPAIGLGLFVARWALMRNSLQTSCLQWVMTRYHTLDTMLEIGAQK